MTKSCLFCRRNGPFVRLEHIIPESLGNDDLVLQGEVCDDCNQFFGSKIEGPVLEKSPLAFWRTFLGIHTKKSNLPHVDLSQPKKQKGRLPSIHRVHDNQVVFTCHEDYSVSVDIGDEQIIREILEGTRKSFTFVFTPYLLSIMGRFLGKVGIELVCLSDPVHARSEAFTTIRDFARYGRFEGLWPIFHFQSGDLSTLRDTQIDELDVIEKVFCYSYSLLTISNRYVLVTLTVGTDTWIMCLNDPYPTPIIREAFPGQGVNLIWYSPEEIRLRISEETEH